MQIIKYAFILRPILGLNILSQQFLRKSWLLLRFIFAKDQRINNAEDKKILVKIRLR